MVLFQAVHYIIMLEVTCFFMFSIQEALHREQMLEQKLATLQRLLAVTQEASDTSWQVLCVFTFVHQTNRSLIYHWITNH